MARQKRTIPHQVQLRGISYEGSPTANLADNDLEKVRDFRVRSYQSALRNVSPRAVAQYVDGNMDVWVNANVGVERGSLRRGQVFGQTVAWLAYSQDRQLVGELLSADNASSSRDGLVGGFARAAKMHLPVLPTIQHGRPALKHTPYRVVREIFGEPEVAAGLMFFAASRSARPDQPMSAFLWSEEPAVRLLPEWGFEVMDIERRPIFGETGPSVTEQYLRAPSAHYVCEQVVQSIASLPEA